MIIFILPNMKKGSVEYTAHVKYSYEDTNEESGYRVYVGSDELDYTSNTTVLSQYEDKTSLVLWQEKLGLEEANKIGAESARVGTFCHAIIEQYLLHGKKPTEQHEIADVAIENFYRHVNKDFVAFEEPVFYTSDTYRVAGRYDQLLRLDENKFVFKNSGKPVPPSYVIADLKTKRSYKPRKDGKGFLRKPLPTTSSVAFILKNCMQISMYAAALCLQTDFVKLYGEGITGGVLVYANEINTRLLYLDRKDLNYYWKIYKLILNDFFGIEKLDDSWRSLCNQSDNRWNEDLNMNVNNIPKEIVLASE